MPWKGEKDPYKIWLSEIILQQTRVQQGLSYYNKFVQTYPQVGDLANAPAEEVFKLWEGLGYYSRCKNLIQTARYIANQYGGIFPSTYGDILNLKGVGPYTAAAIASFAFNLPYAVVDGNVFRVLSRYFAIGLPIDTVEGKKHFTVLANKYLSGENPSLYNQAVMDFGATICTPKNPACDECILAADCKARKSNTTHLLPVKSKKLVKTKRFFYYFVFKWNHTVLVKKRTGKGIWENLNEFYLFENEKPIVWTNLKIKKWLAKYLQIEAFTIIDISRIYEQQLTHQSLEGQFITIGLPVIPLLLADFQPRAIDTINQLPFPKFINQYFEDALHIELQTSMAYAGPSEKR